MAYIQGLIVIEHAINPDIIIVESIFLIDGSV